MPKRSVPSRDLGLGGYDVEAVNWAGTAIWEVAKLQENSMDCVPNTQKI